MASLELGQVEAGENSDRLGIASAILFSSRDCGPAGLGPARHRSGVWSVHELKEEGLGDAKVVLHGGKEDAVVQHLDHAAPRRPLRARACARVRACACVRACPHALRAPTSPVRVCARARARGRACECVWVRGCAEKMVLCSTSAPPYVVSPLSPLSTPFVLVLQVLPPLVGGVHLSLSLSLTHTHTHSVLPLSL